MLFNWRTQPSASAVPNGYRVYAIGDIHGRLDLFGRLLTLIEEEQRALPAAELVVIQLGDLIDRGPDSAGVVARAMDSAGHGRMIVLRGNHEAVMLDALRGEPGLLRSWLGIGGDAALRSWGVPQEAIDTLEDDALTAIANASIPAEQIAWLAERPLSTTIGDYHFVHAGIRPGVPLDRQSPRDQIWIRGAFLGSRRAHGAIIVHGHSIARDVDERPNRIGIDTGAYFSGRLTALVLEGTGRRYLFT